MKSINYIVSLLFIISSCEPEKLTEMDSQRIKVEVRQMLEDYHRDIRRNGLTAEFKYLDQSPDFFWVPPGYKSALSYDSVRYILETNAPAFQSIKFEWKSLAVFPLTPELANYSGIVSSQMTDTAGTEFFSSILESGTLIKRKDGWKLLSGQSRNL